MNETRKALESAVKKWESIASGIGIDRGSQNCALCHLFLRAAYRDCEECPIRKATGMQYCEGTPYDEWEQHMTGVHLRMGLTNPRFCLCLACKEIANEELEFLRDILKDL